MRITDIVGWHVDINVNADIDRDVGGGVDSGVDFEVGRYSDEKFESKIKVEAGS